LLEEGLVENAAKVGAILKEKLSAVKTRHAAIGDVRGLGLMIGVDFERPDGSYAPDGKLRDRIMHACFEKGLLLLSCGQSTMRFCPPLIVTPEETQTAVEIFDAAVASAS
jgi:4-aminobutyrate aminotransferase